MWLGGLFNPEAYITATRQYVAQANGWSLEELSLQVDIPDSSSDEPVRVAVPGDGVGDECSFGIIGKYCHSQRDLHFKSSGA